MWRRQSLLSRSRAAHAHMHSHTHTHTTQRRPDIKSSVNTDARKQASSTNRADCLPNKGRSFARLRCDSSNRVKFPCARHMTGSLSPAPASPQEVKKERRPFPPILPPPLSPLRPPSSHRRAQLFSLKLETK